MLRILIADDHAVVRKGLRDTFNELGDMQVVAEASRGHEVLPQLQKKAVDLVIMDIGLPGRSGLEVLEEVKRRYPKTAVLIFTIHAEEEFAVTAMKSGAAGYLTKESPVEELVRAVRKVAGGSKYVSASLAERLAWHVDVKTAKTRHDDLSAREHQVVRSIASGKSLKHIAEELSVSSKTVTTYRTRALEKMKLKTNADLTRYLLSQQQKQRSQRRRAN